MKFDTKEITSPMFILWSISMLAMTIFAIYLVTNKLQENKAFDTAFEKWLGHNLHHVEEYFVTNDKNFDENFRVVDHWLDNNPEAVARLIEKINEQDKFTSRNSSPALNQFQGGASSYEKQEQSNIKTLDDLQSTEENFVAPSSNQTQQQDAPLKSKSFLEGIIGGFTTKTSPTGDHEINEYIDRQTQHGTQDTLPPGRISDPQEPLNEQ